MADGRQPQRRGGLQGLGIPLGQVFGVKLGADWSLLIIFALILFNLGLGVLPAWHPDWGPVLTWAIALGAAVLFFASVLVHELSHAVVANAHGIPIRRITLFIFGGMAHMEREPPSARSEFWMAIVGPITSVVIGVVALLFGSLLAHGALADYERDPVGALRQVGPLATLFLWLGPINILLGVFNMVPGFPLDGGRVLRAILWGATGSLERATRWASNVGRGFAWLLIATGVLMLFGGVVPILGGGPVQGLWLVLIGWFLNNAAQASYQQMLITTGLRGVRVRDVMRPVVETVSPDASVEELVREHIMRSDQRAFPVVRGADVVGLVCLADVRRVPQAAWRHTPVASVMTPADELVSLRPDEPAEDALQQLSTRAVDQIPVLEDGDLEGLVRREDIVKWLSLRAGAPPDRA
jgi:Zn-dependent protease/CBS domain-containing protein